MTHTYTITGMTCSGCVAKVKSELLKMGDVTAAEVGLAAPQATISMTKHIATPDLQKAVSKAGPYTISEDAADPHAMPLQAEKSSYKPLFVIGAYILGLSLLLEVASGVWVWERWMQHFMAGFFLVFSFFKMLDIKGFAESYSTYDIIAKIWPSWGYVYAFIELGLGIAFLLAFDPILTNGITLVVMSISIIGVLRSVLNKQKIQCACLGTVFNLPMSTVTVVEDALMIAMSAIMLLSMIG